MPTISIRDGQMVGEYIRPDESYLGSPGEENDNPINLDLQIQNADGTYTSIDPEIVIIEDEEHHQEYILPEQNNDNFIIGATEEDDWTAEVALEGTEIIVAWTSNTGSHSLQRLFGIKVISITYQGTTYTEFNYV